MKTLDKKSAAKIPGFVNDEDRPIKPIATFTQAALDQSYMTNPNAKGEDMLAPL